MQLFKRLTIVLLFTSHLFCLNNALAQKSEDSRMDWWREAKFGLFVHWGLYAVPAGEYNGKTNYGEWIMQEASIPVQEYEKFAPQFNPTQFDADAWVKLAREAGMKYLVITSKHHDGFCLWPSAFGKYNIEKSTPFKRDILAELAVACKKYGVVFCLYHSIMDWHHPQQNKAEMGLYTENYLKPQLRELIEKYDPGVLWFDGEWIEEWDQKMGDELYAWLRKIKPNLIINNRVSKGRNGMQGMNKNNAAGDFGTPEQEILEELPNADWETCMTMNNHWGYNKTDNDWKSTHQLIWNLVDVVSKGGNYLLNIGPDATGIIPPASVTRLKQIGQWTKTHEEAIYGIEPWRSFNDGENIRYAQNKAGEVLIYAKHWPGKKLIIRKLKPNKGAAIRMIGQSYNLSWKQGTDGIEINMPENFKAKENEVVVFATKGEFQPISKSPQIGNAAESATGFKVITGPAKVVISTSSKNALIRYTLNGSNPNSHSPVYKQPIPANTNTNIKAVAYEPGKMPSEISTLKLVKGKYALNLLTKPAAQYTALGPVTLVDGEMGNNENFRKGWMGFEGKDVEAIIDLGAARSISKVSLSFLQNHGQWIFLPIACEVLVSDNGTTFKPMATKKKAAADKMENDGREVWDIALNTKARYIKMIVASQLRCPAWHPGDGGKAWLFMDEITVK